MTIADLLCSAVFLPAIGVMASVLSRPKSAEEAPDKNDPLSTGQERIPFRPGLTDEVEVLRAQHQVALVNEKDEGADVARLPGGVYGFTYSPLQATPMFRKKATQSFEVHKLADDSVHLVGFVREGEASRLSISSEELDVRLYPEPREDAFTATSIAVSRIRSSRGPSRSDGNALWLVVG
jgi:hypothetical protein